MAVQRSNEMSQKFRIGLQIRSKFEPQNKPEPKFHPRILHRADRINLETGSLTALTIPDESIIPLRSDFKIS